MKNLQLRWLVTQKPESHEWGGKKWTSLRESQPVLQYWNGENWVDVPTVKEVKND